MKNGVTLNSLYTINLGHHGIDFLYSIPRLPKNKISIWRDSEHHKEYSVYCLSFEQLVITIYPFLAEFISKLSNFAQDYATVYPKITVAGVV